MRAFKTLITGDVGLGILSCLLATVVGVITLQAWRFDLSTPMYYLGDTIQIHGYVQNVIESGWVTTSGPRLGAPFGQEYFDFPLGSENLSILLIRLVAGVTGDAVTTVNLVFLATFPLVALTAFWALRRLGVSGAVAVLGSVVYAVLPFHFLRNAHHLLLAAYYVVPIACFVLVRAIDGRPMFGLGRDKLHARGRRWVPVVGATALAALIASSGTYYAGFTLLLIVPATVIGWTQTRSRPIVISGLLMAGAIVLFMALNSAPTLLYWLQNGGNADVPIRHPIETAHHQLNPISLVMPVLGHRIGPLARLAARYSGWYAGDDYTGENGDALGLFAAIGFVLLIVVALGAVVGLFRKGRTWLRERRLAALTLIALAISMAGGLSTVIALLATAQIRAWGRMQIFIAFFAVLALSLILSVAWRWARRRGWRVPAAVALVLVFAFATWEMTSPTFAPPIQPTVDRFLADRAFVQEVEASLPAGAAIYQLPYRQYPEAGPREGATDYDNLRPYINSDALRFSYGGMKGREAGWQTYVYGRPPREALPLISLAGFSAVWVDRSAYADQGVAVERELTDELGVVPTVSEDGRNAVFDMRPYTEKLNRTIDPAMRLRLGDRRLAPVWLRWRGGAWDASIEDDGVITRPIDPTAVLSLVNGDSDERPVTVSFNVGSIAAGGTGVSVEWPDGVRQDLDPSATGPVTRTIPLAPGENIIKFHVAGTLSGAAPAAEIRDLWAVDPVLLEVQPPAQ